MNKFSWLTKLASSHQHSTTHLHWSFHADKQSFRVFKWSGPWWGVRCSGTTSMGGESLHGQELPRHLWVRTIFSSTQITNWHVWENLLFSRMAPTYSFKSYLVCHWWLVYPQCGSSIHMQHSIIEFYSQHNTSWMPLFVRESSRSDSLSEAEASVARLQALNSPLVNPIITPR